MKKQFFTKTRICYQVIENNIVPRKLVLLYFKFPLKFLSLTVSPGAGMRNFDLDLDTL